MAVDFRSDTLTLPSDDMRRAMATAEVGDDVFGEDPTIAELERRAADATGKAEGIFVASGTMGNLLAILALAGPGQEIIADADSHIFLNEGGGAATLGGIQIRQISTPAGIMSTEHLEGAVRPTDDYHQPITRAICLEDTHNRHGGVCWPLEDLARVREFAGRHDVAVHLDGARVFNAAVAQQVAVRDITAHVDTVTFCVSKGLGAPVGSVLCGPAGFADRARRWRKMVGGGWRQAGVVAAAGLFALDHMVDRLPEDHANARTLAEGLAELPGISIDLDRVQTNLVAFQLTSMPPATFLEECGRRGLLAEGQGGRQIRFVTRYGVDAADVQRALAICSEVLTAA